MRVVPFQRPVETPKEIKVEWMKVSVYFCNQYQQYSTLLFCLPLMNQMCSYFRQFSLKTVLLITHIQIVAPRWSYMAHWWKGSYSLWIQVCRHQLSESAAYKLHTWNNWVPILCEAPGLSCYGKFQKWWLMELEHSGIYRPTDKIWWPKFCSL